MGSVTDNAEFFKDLFSWVGDLFKGLDYFTGEKFAEFAAGGFMK